MKGWNPFKDKMLALLIQLPPSYQIKEGLQDFISSGVNKFYTTSRWSEYIPGLCKQLVMSIDL
jgi:hypothetical protein